MEPNPDESTSFKIRSKQHVLKKILSDRKRQKSKFASSSNMKKSEESKKTDPNSEKSEDDLERPSSGTSPEPNCAICLEPLQNKSFTDSCFHTFCFTCLLEWSKVKAECPLCKQKFKSIVHSLKQDLTYDQYIIGSKRGSKFAEFIRTEPSSFPGFFASRILERNRNRTTYQESYQSQIASHRMRFAPHSVNLYSNAQIMSRLPCPFRRRVYEQNLWVKTSLNGRSRVATPEFYKRNPACTHRLIPWLNRELVSLWQDNEDHVTFVLELIMSLVQRFHINSQEFLIHIEPYMGRNTHHFIHEFYTFAISPYDMENYDTHADYGLVPHIIDDDDDRSSPDSDVIALFTEDASLQRQRQERKNMRQRALNHLKMILKKSGGNSWESYLSPASSSYMSSSWSNPGPSTSGFRAREFFQIDASTSNFASVSDVEQTDDDEIQVLNVVKPRAERTPEIVDLSSDEEVPVPVIDVSSDEGNFSLVYSPTRVTPPLAAISVNDASSDIEYVLECQPSTSRDIPTKSEISSETVTKMEEDVEQKESPHHSSDTEEFDSDVPLDEDVENEVKKAPKLASAIVRPWLTESESSCKAFAPHVKRHLSASYLNDSLSEFDARSSDSERKRNTKKLKLQSVVACYSIDRSSGSKRDSSHRSSYKKHKEKRKKKKHKHIRQHRYNRIYSDSESN